MSQPTKIKIEFAPGAFDSFEGTQEELDQLIAEITQMAESGELFEKSEPLDIDNIDIDDLMEEDPMLAESLIRSMADNKRTLQ